MSGRHGNREFQKAGVSYHKDMLAVLVPWAMVLYRYKWTLNYLAQFSREIVSIQLVLLFIEVTPVSE